MASGGSDMAGPIWRNMMRKLLNGSQNVAFTTPSGIVQRAVCTSNGGLASASGNGTYNEYFMAGALPTTSCDPEPTMITVCNLKTKQVESIDEKKYEAQTYSKDINACKEVQIQVCELASGSIITIDESDFDEEKYSKITSSCGDGDEDGGDGNTTTGNNNRTMRQ
jgi:hypothetical protein